MFDKIDGNAVSRDLVFTKYNPSGFSADVGRRYEDCWKDIQGTDDPERKPLPML